METENNKSKAEDSLIKYASIVDMLVENGTIAKRELVGSVEPKGDGAYEVTLVANVNVKCNRSEAAAVIGRAVKRLFDSMGNEKIVIEKKHNRITVSLSESGLVIRNIELIN